MSVPELAQQEQDMALDEPGPRLLPGDGHDPAGSSGCVWPALLCREAVPGGICLLGKEMPRTSLHCEPWEKTAHICFGNGLPNGSLLQMAICAVCCWALQSTDYPRHV